MSRISTLKLMILYVLCTGCNLSETKVILHQQAVAYVYDGDTITFHCIGGYRCHKNKTKVRVKGVDTPEIKANCAREKLLARQAKQHTVALLREAEVITLLIDDTRVYDRYQRLLAYVYIDGQGLHDSLISKGLGVDYQGHQRQRWCD